MIRKTLATLLLVLITLSSAPAADAAAPTEYESKLAQIRATAGKDKEHDRLLRLFDANWNYVMHEYPEWATGVGYPGQNGKWTDQSLAAIDRRKHETVSVLSTVKTIDRSKLNKQDQLNYDIFRYRVENSVAGFRFPDELLAISQLDGVQQSPAMTLEQNPTTTVKDYEDILSRLRTLPGVIDQNIELLQLGLKKGITPPKVTMRDVAQQIKAQIVTDGKTSPLFTAFHKFPSTIPAAEQKRLSDTAAGIIQTNIARAYQKFYDFFVGSYEPACRQSLALTELPNGKAWYAQRALESTTTHLSPTEIHNIGLSEVKRIRSEMDKIMAETGFKGSFKEFCEFLRTDPKFFHTQKEDLLAGYRDIAKRIDPALIRQFGKLPRLPYGVEPVPDYSEKSQPTAYYMGGNLSPGRAGVFYANTYDLKSRPKWEMQPLTLHEAVPGHHLQIALAQESESLPNFRRHGGFTAYVEGWGLYAESLGYDLGMYTDPYDRFGQLSYDIWRSIRLVLDTGIHTMGWSRQQAIDFFAANSSKPMHDIEVEVDRYIVWPGQALAYKIGQLQFKQLKAKSRSELASKYDVRKFHDFVLGLGAVPIDVLKAQTDLWLAGQKQATKTSAR